MLYQIIALQALSSSANAETECGGHDQQCCSHRVVGQAAPVYTCDSSLKPFVKTDWKKDFCVCIADGADSNKLGHPSGWIPGGLHHGDRCLLNEHPSDCTYPLVCKGPIQNLAGNYEGTCQYNDPWDKPFVYSYEGGKCGEGDSPLMTAYKCAAGLKCVSSGLVGGYGRCQTTATSTEGGPCGKGAFGRTDYKCADGLTCIPVYISGHYGYCKREITWSSVGGYCGTHGWESGVYSTKNYRCKGDLVCHVSVQGHYGHCRRPSHHHNPVPSPVPSPVSPPSASTGTVCGSGSAGRIRCPDGLICYGANPSASLYGTCQKPGFGGRRLSLGEVEPEQLEAPVAEE